MVSTEEQAVAYLEALVGDMRALGMIAPYEGVSLVAVSVATNGAASARKIHAVPIPATNGTGGEA